MKSHLTKEEAWAAGLFEKCVISFHQILENV